MSVGTTVGSCLIEELIRTGAGHVFGLQGDYVLGFYSQLCESPLRVVNTCDEQGAGFAADAYARTAGFGVVCVTYGVGGLKLANSTAQAFAERSPVLVISGAPGMNERGSGALTHHKIASFESQLNVFREMTSAQAVLDDPAAAPSEIRRVIETILRTKRPGYIELPRDLVRADIPVTREEERDRKPGPADEGAGAVDGAPDGAMKEALSETLEMLTAAERAVAIVGLEVQRFGLQALVLEFLERSGLPFVTGILGKSGLPEDHPRFVGVYAGGMSPDDVRETVEGADCVIAVGPLVTDLATGIFTHNIDTGRAVVISREGVMVRRHEYPRMDMERFLRALNSSLTAPADSGTPVKRHELGPFTSRPGVRITMDRLLACVNSHLDVKMTVVAEPGDALFGSLDLLIRAANGFVSPAYYASLGFSVPACIGVQLASPDRRPLALTGDGSFQMTGMELSTCVRYGLNPVVIVLNNGGYSTFRPMADGPFNDIQPWRYAEIPNIVGGGRGFTVSTEEDFETALLASLKDRSSFSLIDVLLDKSDISARLRKLTSELRKRVS